MILLCRNNSTTIKHLETVKLCFLIEIVSQLPVNSVRFEQCYRRIENNGPPLKVRVSGVRYLLQILGIFKIGGVRYLLQKIWVGYVIYMRSKNIIFFQPVAVPPCKIDIVRSKIVKIFRLRRAFPLVKLIFEVRNCQNFPPAAGIYLVKLIF